MGRKTRGQLARAKSLKIARQTRLSELGRSVAGPSDDLEASYNDAGAEPEVTCPSGDLSPVNTENENAPGARDTLASEDGEDGTDPSDLSDGLDLVENTALQTFASMLQEAQRLAIRLEREKESQKRRTPKTYRGDSKRTLYRREKARKALASQGFLDIRSFLALKKEERESGGQERGYDSERELEGVDTRGAQSGRSDLSPTPAMADRMSSGGSLVNESGDDDPLPWPIHRARDQSGDTAGAREPGRAAHKQCRRVQTTTGGGSDELVDPLEVGREGLSDRTRGGDANEMGDAVRTQGRGRIGRGRCGLAEESEESSSESEELLSQSGAASHMQSERTEERTEACNATGALRPDDVARRMRIDLAEELESGSDDIEGPNDGGNTSLDPRVRAQCANADEADNALCRPQAEPSVLSRISDLVLEPVHESSDADNGNDLDLNEGDEELPVDVVLRNLNPQNALDMALDEIRHGSIPTDLGPLLICGMTERGSERLVPLSWS
ncbi:hypothetical protein EI94DRAFT_1698238 [Lactarius quietus]|nr:hypothetical protein EI94DRAFT_1698238 [Lactarius quietus]